MYRVLALLLITIAATTVPAGGQNIRGRLLDAGTHAAIEGGTIVLLSEDSVQLQSVVTNEAGEFRLAAPGAGGYRLAAQRIGYRSAASPVIELETRDSLEVEFLISTEAVLLKPLTVVATSARPRVLSGFYDRKERGFGTFITREDIERLRPIYPSDLLRTIPGVQVVPTWWGRSVVLLRGRCVPQIFLDGMRIRSASIDDLVSVLDLEGIEVYRSAAEAPAELSGFSSCGTIALWTRRGP